MILLLTFWFGISLIHQKMRKNENYEEKKLFIFMTLIMFVLKFLNLIKQRDLILEKLNYIVTQYLP
jgi:hypothetical protein